MRKPAPPGRQNLLLIDLLPMRRHIVRRIDAKPQDCVCFSLRTQRPLFHAVVVGF